MDATWEFPVVSDHLSRSPINANAGDRRFFALAAIALLFKLALAAVVPLSADESYYWVWSKHLDFGYFDHPPMVAWLFSLGRLFEPLGPAVRFPAVLLGHATIFLWFAILKDVLSGERRLTWLLLFLACPLTGLGGIIVTPDLPLLFFWSLAVFFVAKILRAPSPAAFLGFGAALGLGFCSKYQIVLFPLSLLFLLARKDVRRALLRPGLFLTFMSGLLFCAPVLGWNAQHDWQSFTFQMKHGLRADGFSWRWPLEYIVGETLLLFPAVIWFAAREKAASPLVRILQALAVIPLGFFLLTSLRAPTELNWPVMAFPAVFALAAVHINKKSVLADVLFWSVAQLALVVSIFLPAGLQLHEKLTEPVRFKSVADLPKTQTPLFASTYQMASSLWFVSGVPVYKLRGMSRVDMFDQWPGSAPPSGRFFLLREEGQLLPDALREAPVRRVSSPAPGLELLEVNAP